MSQYYVVISFQFEGEKETTILLDTINDVQVSMSSTITEHPVPTGDIVADHMFKNPATMDISGSISLAGSSQNVLGTEGNKLVNFQELFEKIKNTGTLCTIYKLNTLTNDIRFVKRDRMALNNIRWVERINTLDFTFSFRQILAVTIQELKPATDDKYLPNVTEPNTLSFTDTLLDWNKVSQSVFLGLFSLNLVTSEFATYIVGANEQYLKSIGLNTQEIKAVLALVSKANASGYVGSDNTYVSTGSFWDNFSIVRSYREIKTWFKNRESKKEAENNAFKYYSDSKQMAQEVRRFATFANKIYDGLQALNNAINVYQIASDKEQECMLSIGYNYYIFSFFKNNTSGKYSLKVTGGADDIDKEQAIVDDISGAPMSLYDCNDVNKLMLTTDDNIYVYLIKIYPKDENKLTSYAILTSTLQPSNFDNDLFDIITSMISLA